MVLVVWIKDWNTFPVLHPHGSHPLSKRTIMTKKFQAFLFLSMAVVFGLTACAPAAATSSTPAESTVPAQETSTGSSAATSDLTPATNPLALKPGEFSRFWTVQPNKFIEIRFELNGEFSIGSRLNFREDVCWADRAEFDLSLSDKIKSKDGVTATKSDDGTTLTVVTDLSAITVGNLCYDDSTRP